MRVARFKEFGKPLSIEDIPRPKSGAREVVVKIYASGLCDTDCRLTAVETPALSSPRTLGHQIAGRVESVGCDVTGVEIGMSVIVNFLIACGQCKYCRAGADSQCDQLETIGVVRDGGFAEYVALPADNILPIPDDVNMVDASFIGCGLATPFRALRQGRVQKDEVVLLIGEGLWTLDAIDICQALGAMSVLWSDNESFIKKAHLLGVEDVTSLKGSDLGEWLMIKSGGFGADLIIDFEATPDSVNIAQHALGKGGRCVFVGHAGSTGSVTTTFPMMQFMESEITGSCLIRASEVKELIDLVSNEKLSLSKLVTEVISLDDINEGLSKVAQDSSLGIVVEL